MHANLLTLQLEWVTVHAAKSIFSLRGLSFSLMTFDGVPFLQQKTNYFNAKNGEKKRSIEGVYRTLVILRLHFFG